MKNFSLFLLLLLTLGLGACGNDDDGPSGPACNNTWTVEVQDELNDVTNAATAYSNDPSAANCNALKNAYNNYIDAIEDFEDCARLAGDLANWQAAIDNARAEVATIC